MKILILGASGLIGKALFKELQEEHDVYGTYNTQSSILPKDRGVKFDINASSSLNDLLDTINPQCIISCLTGDFSAQLKCHSDIAHYLKRKCGKLIFCSTANVFDGNPWHAHDEFEEPYPISRYGKFKVECENMLKAILDENLVIVRLPAILGHDCKSWREIETEYNNGDINVFSNIYKTTNTDVNVAKSIHYIIKQKIKGTLHLTSEDLIKMSTLIRQMVEQLNLKNPTYCETELTTEQYYSALGCTIHKGLREINHAEPPKYYLALKSIRNELPQEYRITNRQVLNCRN